MRPEVGSSLCEEMSLLHSTEWGHSQTAHSPQLGSHSAPILHDSQGFRTCRLSLSCCGKSFDMAFGHLKWPARVPSRPELPVLALSSNYCLPPLLKKCCCPHLHLRKETCPSHVSFLVLVLTANPSLDLGAFSLTTDKHLLRISHPAECKTKRRQPFVVHEFDGPALISRMLNTLPCAPRFCHSWLSRQNIPKSPQYPFPARMFNPPGMSCHEIRHNVGKSKKCTSILQCASRMKIDSNPRYQILIAVYKSLQACNLQESKVCGYQLG